MLVRDKSIIKIEKNSIIVVVVFKQIRIFVCLLKRKSAKIKRYKTLIIKKKRFEKRKEKRKKERLGKRWGPLKKIKHEIAKLGEI